MNLIALIALIPAPYRILALIVLALALFAFGWVKGAQQGEARLAAYKAATEKAVQARLPRPLRPAPISHPMHSSWSK